MLLRSRSPRAYRRPFSPWRPPITLPKGWGSVGRQHKVFRSAGVYWLYTLLIVMGAGFVLIPRLPLIRLIMISQVANGIFLPFALFYMLKLVNCADSWLPTRIRESRTAIAWTTSGVMVALTVALIWTSLFSG